MVLLVGSTGSAQDKGRKIATDELDSRIRANINRVINTGADMFNAGDHQGCYQLFRGALTAVSTLLDHRPALAKSINSGLEKAEKTASAADRAWALREVMDEIMKALPRPKGSPEKAKSLWDRLGGEPAVRAVVKELTARAAADPKVNFTRGGKYKLDEKALATFQQHMVEFVSAATGGPLKYKGKDMKTAHKGMHITDAEFNALAADLSAVLDKFKVPARDKKELLAKVASTRKDIVEGKPAKPKTKTLYERLGGAKAVEAVVADFVERAAKDAKINFTRKGTRTEWKPTPENIETLKKHLVGFVSTMTGGPKTYKGKDMKTAHKGMHITKEEFNAAVNDLRATLDELKVPEKEKKELLNIIRGTRKAIIEDKPAKPKDKDKDKEKDK
jgi:hemoglobin